MSKAARTIALYTLLLVAGSAMIVGGVPLLEISILPAPLSAVRQWIDSVPALDSAASALRANLSLAPVTEPVPPAWPAEPAVPVASPGEAPAPAAAASAQPEAPVTAAPPAPGEVAVASVPPPGAEAPVSRLVEPPPAPRWGVVHGAPCPVYNESGKALGKLSTGSVVEVVEVRNTRSGEFAQCVVLRGTNFGANPVMVRTESLALSTRAGSEEEQDLWSRRAVLQFQIEKARTDDSAEIRADNPHAAEYVAARDDYKEYWKRTKALHAARDVTEGLARQKYEDDLRKIRSEEFQIRGRYESAKGRYQSWNAAHPPKTQDLERELQRVNRQIEALSDRDG